VTLWLIAAQTAMYISTLSARNIYVMRECFMTYPFTLVATGNQAPHIIIMILYVTSFLKLHSYTKENKFTAYVYFKIYIHRFCTFAPLYYFLFFAGWAIIPLLSNKAGWYVAGRFFESCNEQVWSVLLFINQLWPYFTSCSEGCYYWPYIIPNDMLLFLFFPLFVVAYQRNKVIFYVSTILFMGIGLSAMATVAYLNDLRVGAI